MNAAYGLTLRERRCLARKPKAPWYRIKDADQRRLVLALVVLATVLLALALPFIPVRSRAVSETPIGDYPRTNRGSCMMIRDRGWEVIGASAAQVRELCAEEGINLTTK